MSDARNPIALEADVERLRQDVQDRDRLLWIIVKALGGVHINRHRMRQYPGDDLAELSSTTYCDEARDLRAKIRE